MDALHLLTTRRSSKKLTAPAPNAEQLEAMLQAATQVPDHGNMRPFRFTVIQSAEGLQRFREILCRTCAAYGLQLAASAQGFDNVWITGMWVNSPLLREAFGCSDKDKIIGLMMIGSSVEEGGGAKNTDLEQFVTTW